MLNFSSLKSINHSFVNSTINSLAFEIDPDIYSAILCATLNLAKISTISGDLTVFNFLPYIYLLLHAMFYPTNVICSLISFNVTNLHGNVLFNRQFVDSEIDEVLYPHVK